MLTRRNFLQQLGTGIGLGANFAGDILAAPAVRARTYTNPVWRGSMPDPGVMRHQNVYYAFGTTGAERKADGRIFTLLRSDDLVNWKELGGALVPPADAEGYQFWAPEAVESDGKFYLYYSMGGKKSGGFTLRVATSERPEGPYRDAADASLNDRRANGFMIDPHPFRDTDGQWYLFYARDYLDAENGAFPGTALAVDKLVGMTKLAGEAQTVMRARYAWTLYESNRYMEAYRQTFAQWHTMEGPWVVKHAGRYYCFYSGANYQTDRYGVDYGVADRVMGPYSNKGAENGARVLHTVAGHVRGPGHHSIVMGPDDATEYVVYHAWDEGLKVRQMCVDKLAWTAHGPRCAPTWTPQRIPRR